MQCIFAHVIPKKPVDGVEFSLKIVLYELFTMQCEPAQCSPRLVLPKDQSSLTFEIVKKYILEQNLFLCKSDDS